MKHRWHDRLIQFTILASVLLLIFEIDAERIAADQRAPGQFWWAEICIAVILTAEAVWRAIAAHKREAHHTVELETVETGSFHHSAAIGLNNVVGIKAHLNSIELWIDIISVLPFWLSFLLPDTMDGTLRSLRILRLLKLYHYSHAAHMIAAELLVRYKQIRVLTYITGAVALLGSVGIYELERHAQPDAFGTISDSMWWMVVTMTTVGYGDVSPHTPAGKLFAMVLMPITLGIMGAVIGIVGGAFAEAEVLERKEEDIEEEVKESEAELSD